MSNVKCHKGFSLVELIFAIVFLTVVVLGVMRLQTSNLALSNTNKKEVEAYFWANQGIEAVAGLGYANISCPLAYPCIKFLKLVGSDYQLSDTSPGNVSPAPFIQSLNIDNTGLTAAYKVTSRIDWTDSTGSHSVEVKRIIF